MRCADGTRLATRIWSPDPGGPHGPGPWPVLLMRQPYGRAIASTVTYAHPEWYAAQGFLVAVQDVRGRGDSGGRFRGFRGEAADGAAAVRWARGLEGADGRVGSYGFSYQGLTQLLQAPECLGISDGLDPLPDCVVPAMTGVDERRHWASEGGAHWWGPGLAWALQLAAEGCRRRGDREGWREIRRSLAAGAYLEEGLQLLERHDPRGMGLDWLRRDPAEPAGWRIHRVEPALLRRPMLLIGGWHDPHLHGVLDLWRRAREAGGRPGLVVGRWTHLDWNGGLDALQLAFFRRHLTAAAVSRQPAAPQPGPGHPLEAVLEGGLALELEGGGGWLQGPEAEAVAVGAAPLRAITPPPSPPAPQPHSGPEGRPRWGLRSEGLAAISSSEGQLLSGGPPPTGSQDPNRANPQQRAGQPDAGLGGALEPEGPGRGSSGPMGGVAACPPLILVHDPWRPLPARGGHLGMPPGPVDRADLDRRPDVACFTGAPEPQGWLLLGRPRLSLVVAADQPGFDLCVALSWLPAGGGDGAVRQLSTGVARFLGPTALEPLRRTVDLQPLALRIGPGDRLRLSIGAAAWPAIAVNPGDGSQPRGGSGPGHRVISLRLDCGSALLELDPLLLDAAACRPRELGQTEPA